MVYQTKQNTTWNYVNHYKDERANTDSGACFSIKMTFPGMVIPLLK